MGINDDAQNILGLGMNMMQQQQRNEQNAINNDFKRQEIGIRSRELDLKEDSADTAKKFTDETSQYAGEMMDSINNNVEWSAPEDADTLAVIEAQKKLAENMEADKNFEQFRMQRNKAIIDNTKMEIAERSRVANSLPDIDSQIEAYATDVYDAFPDGRTARVEGTNLIWKTKHGEEIVTPYPSKVAMLADLKRQSNWLIDPKNRVEADKTIMMTQLEKAAVNKEAPTIVMKNAEGDTILRRDLYSMETGQKEPQYFTRKGAKPLTQEQVLAGGYVDLEQAEKDININKLKQQIKLNKSNNYSINKSRVAWGDDWAIDEYGEKRLPQTPEEEMKYRAALLYHDALWNGDIESLGLGIEDKTPNKKEDTAKKPRPTEAESVKIMAGLAKDGMKDADIIKHMKNTYRGL